MAPVLIDFEKVCRLCFRDDDGRSKMTSIYEQQDLEETIYKCVQIEVLLGSHEPTNICASCMLSLDSWSKFKMLCDNTNAFLHQYTQDNNEPDVVFSSEITNLGTLGFTPSQMSDLSIGFFENDSLWNNSMLQQWGDVDMACSDLPVPRYTKKVQPPEDLLTDAISSEECMDMALNVLSKKNDNFTYTKAHWWNPKAISMNTIQKENEKPTSRKRISKTMSKYNRYERKTYSCNICSETFSKFNDLLIHDSVEHIDMSKNISCEKCGKLFLTKERLDVHETFHREKLFECHLCQKKFTLQKTLDSHLNAHIGLYTCQKCGYKAHSMYNLKVHENTHSLIKSHCCKECDKYFATLSSLRRHDRIVHKNIILFRCDQCDYSTNQSSSLQNHKTIHTPQMFICDHCGSSFKNRHSFMLHSKLHKNAQFICTHCNKAFRKKSNLKEHLSNSHDLGPKIKRVSKCDVCEKCFSRNKYLQIHKNKCHSI